MKTYVKPNWPKGLKKGRRDGVRKRLQVRAHLSSWTQSFTPSPAGHKLTSGLCVRVYLKRGGVNQQKLEEWSPCKHTESGPEFSAQGGHWVCRKGPPGAGEGQRGTGSRDWSGARPMGRTGRQPRGIRTLRRTEAATVWEHGG